MATASHLHKAILSCFHYIVHQLLSRQEGQGSEVIQVQLATGNKLGQVVVTVAAKYTTKFVIVAWIIGVIPNVVKNCREKRGEKLKNIKVTSKRKEN